MNEIIKAKAQELGLKQVDIVRATGASKGTVSKWFSGELTPEEYLVDLAHLLQLSPFHLKNGKRVEKDGFSQQRQLEEQLLEWQVFGTLLNEGLKVFGPPTISKAYDMEISCPYMIDFASFYVETKIMKSQEEADRAKEANININKKIFTKSKFIKNAIIVTQFDVFKGNVLSTIISQLKQITGLEVDRIKLTKRVNPKSNQIGSPVLLPNEVFENLDTVQYIELIKFKDSITPPTKNVRTTFAFTNFSESMSPDFCENEVIFASIKEEVKNGDFVLAKLEDGSIVVRQLIIEGGHLMLKATNPSWPSKYIPIEDPAKVRMLKIVASQKTFD